MQQMSKIETIYKEKIGMIQEQLGAEIGKLKLQLEKKEHEIKIL